MSETTVIVPYQIARVVHRAEVVLAAAGAFSTQAFFVVPVGVTDVQFYIRYTRAAGTTGSPLFRLQIGNGTEQVVPCVIDGGSLVIASGVGRMAQGMAEVSGPIPPTDAAIDFGMDVCLRRGVTQLRLQVAELGAIATPGTCLITLTAGCGG